MTFFTNSVSLILETLEWKKELNRNGILFNLDDLKSYFLYY